MSDSKSGSKADLNESNLPLLSEEATGAGDKAGDTPEKEVQEMEMEEKKDDNSEKKEETKEKKKKEKKEKKEKVKKEKGPSCVDTFSAGLDLNNRDNRNINTQIDIDFDGVLAEPGSVRGFEETWKLTFVIFSTTKLWLYKIMSALVSIPLAVLWAVLFSVLTVLYVWIISPSLRVTELVFAVFRRFLVSLLDATVVPFCSAIGHVFPANRSPAQNLLESA